MGKQNTKIKQKINPFLSILFAFVIPIIVVITITIILLTVSGVNVVDWIKHTGSNIPVVSSFVKTDEEEQLQKKYEKSQTRVTEQDAEINHLHHRIQDLEKTIEQLEQKKENNSEDEVHTEEMEENGQVKKLAASFKTMNKKQAGLIFQDLDKEIAILILQELSNDVRGEILEKMDPAFAATLSKQFINN